MGLLLPQAHLGWEKLQYWGQGVARNQTRIGRVEAFSGRSSYTPTIKISNISMKPNTWNPPSPLGYVFPQIPLPDLISSRFQELQYRCPVSYVFPKEDHSFKPIHCYGTTRPSHHSFTTLPVTIAATCTSSPPSLAPLYNIPYIPQSASGFGCDTDTLSYLPAIPHWSLQVCSCSSQGS